MTAIDLTDIPLVDNHCHGILRRQPVGAAAWRERFTESRDPGMQRDHVTTTLLYRRLIREMAAFFDCAPNEDAVLEARRGRDDDALIGDLLRAARIEALLIDQGYPPPDQVVPDAELGRLAGCRIFPMLRVEVLMQELIIAHGMLDAVVEALQAALVDVRAQGYVALKSIAAYRTGLDIQTWPREEAQAAFGEARREAVETGTLRLAHKPLLDTLLHVVFHEAARQDMPIQFHVGYGDADADMLRANPLRLRAVLEERAYRSMPIVLLHECYPYTREGAYLAAVYENVYLDLSYGIPFLGYGEMAAFTRAAFGVAPISKLLYSSDGVGVPELHWMSALHGRRILGETLGEIVAQGDLSVAEAEAAGAAVLRDNATRLYRLIDY
ncbi:MAG: amidohydrolase family protein [Chloroflexota bacterium]|nr:amidohydrolase family protein [Chloroflexota bacterium]